MTTSERWILSEWQVACDREARFGETLRGHRVRTPFAEIDLIFLAGERLRLVEVKSWSRELWGARPLSRAQIRRLLRARSHVESKFGRETILQLAVVSHVRGALHPSIDYFEGESLAESLLT